MTSPRKRSLVVLVVGLVAFAVLAVRFSPNWLGYQREHQATRAQVAAAAQPVVDKAFTSTVGVERGRHVMRQVADLGANITDTNHKIVRWRLLFPALGHFLGLPGEVVLGFAHLGCIVFAIACCAVGFRTGGTRTDAFCLAIVAGASAPFFTSMGWLGYFDIWLALALLAVGFARSRALLLAACALGPWVDERMVVALPLALGVRWAVFDEAASDLGTWIRRDVAPSLLLVLAFAGVRLALGGSGGSQTVRRYLEEFVQARSYEPWRILHGAWEGLRFGWILVGYVAFEGLRALRLNRRRGWQLVGVSVAAAATTAVGLFTALDMSRSMVLVAPVVPLGWILVRRTAAWNRFHLAPVAAAAALLVPAQHVVTRFVIPVDTLWSRPFGVSEALNHIGFAYRNGEGVPQDDAEAIRWFRQALALGSPSAACNLGLMFETGSGVPKDPAEALRLYRWAAKRRDSPSQCRIGLMYFRGEGVPMDQQEGAKWIRQAALQGLPVAQYNLGQLYSSGLGVPRDDREGFKWHWRAAMLSYPDAQAVLGDRYAEGGVVPKDCQPALDWYGKAARQGHAHAQSCIGVMFATGHCLPQDQLEAMAWFYLAAEGRNPAAMQYVERGERHLSGEQRARARDRSRELRDILVTGRPWTPAAAQQP